MRITLAVLATTIGFVAAAPCIATAQGYPSTPKPSSPQPTTQQSWNSWSGMAIDTTGLNLNRDQQTKFRKIRDDLQRKQAPLRQQAQQVMGGKSTLDLTPQERETLRPKLQPIMDQLQENDRQAREQVAAILTPDQKAKFDQQIQKSNQGQDPSQNPSENPDPSQPNPKQDRMPDQAPPQ